MIFRAIENEIEKNRTGNASKIEALVEIQDLVERELKAEREFAEHIEKFSWFKEAIHEMRDLSPIFRDDYADELADHVAALVGSKDISIFKRLILREFHRRD